jgi:hypothetical protein
MAQLSWQLTTANIRPHRASEELKAKIDRVLNAGRCVHTPYGTIAACLAKVSP